MKRVAWISTVTARGIFFLAGPSPVSAQRSQGQTEGSEIEEIVITGSDLGYPKRTRQLDGEYQLSGRERSLHAGPRGLPENRG
jgi:hypothetical protein